MNRHTISIEDDHPDCAESTVRPSSDDVSAARADKERNEQAAAQALSVSLGIADKFPWIGPLVEAALVCPKERRRPVQVMTKWGGFPLGMREAYVDEKKHQLYAAHILKLLEEACPWLLALLNASQVSLLVYPGECRYTVIADPEWDRPPVAHDMPLLVPLTQMTPFPPEEADTVH